MSAENVIFHSLDDIMLHQWNMFMRCCVKYNIRMIGAENIFKFSPVGYGTDFYLKGEHSPPISHDEFLLKIIGTVFINIQHNQHFGRHFCNLPAKLTPDGTTAAGDKNCFARIKCTDIIIHELFCISEEQLFDTEFPQSTLTKLTGLGKRIVINQDFAAGFSITLIEFIFLFCMHAGKRKNNLLYLHRFELFLDGVVFRNDGNAIDLPLCLAHIVINKTNRSICSILVREKFFYKHCPDSAGSDNSKLFTFGWRDLFFLFFQNQLRGFIGIITCHKMDYLADSRECPDTAAAIFKNILIQKAGRNCFQQVEGNNTNSANKRDAYGAFRQQKLNNIINNPCTHIC